MILIYVLTHVIGSFTGSQDNKVAVTRPVRAREGTLMMGTMTCTVNLGHPYRALVSDRNIYKPVFSYLIHFSFWKCANIEHFIV